MADISEQSKLINQQIAEENERQAKIEQEKILLLSEELKLNKASVKAGKEYTKTLQQGEKSLSGILGSLLQGNIAQAAEITLSKKALNSTKLRAEENKKITQGLKDNPDFVKLTAENKMKVLSVVQEINSGMADQAAAQATLEDIGEGQLSQNSNLAKDLKGFAVMGEEEANQKDILADNQLTLNKHLGRGALVFGALVAIAQKFAGSVDAIGAGFGSLNVTSDAVKHNLMDAEIASAGIGATMEDVVAVTNEIAGDFGVGAVEASKMSAQLLDTAKAVGMSNEEAAKLSGILQTTSGLSAEQAEELTEGAYQLAQANNVAPKAVMQDLAASAEEFASFSKDGGDNLVKAAIQARALGLSLQDTAKISEGLLNFQDSITKEVEASVLIGRQLNLQKARELALNNDIEGAMRAVVDQVGSESEFNKLNAIQRKALADSIGVEVSQLAKMVANSEKANVVAGETAKSFGDIMGKEAMSNLTAMMNELKVFGAAIVQIVGPVIELVLKVVNPLLSIAGALAQGLTSAFRMDFGGANMNDGVVGPGGISMMAGSAGVFKLNPRDSVMATTNPIPVNDIRTGPAGSMGGGANVQISSKMIKLGGGDLGLAIDAYTYPSNGGQGRTAFDSVTGRV